MPVRSLQDPPAEMPDVLRRRAERLLAEGAAMHVEAESTCDHELRLRAIDVVEDAIALFNEFDPAL